MPGCALGERDGVVVEPLEDAVRRARGVVTGRKAQLDGLMGGGVEGRRPGLAVRLARERNQPRADGTEDQAARTSRCLRGWPLPGVADHQPAWVVPDVVGEGPCGRRAPAAGGDVEAEMALGWTTDCARPGEVDVLTDDRPVHPATLAPVGTVVAQKSIG